MTTHLLSGRRMGKRYAYACLAVLFWLSPRYA